METASSMPRVAVVGGGIAGLTAAARLSENGVHVTLIEKATAIGGRATTLSKAGFFLNLGPHALYRGGPAYKFLSDSNIVPAGASAKFRKAVAISGGEFLEVPLSLTSLISTSLLDVGEKIELVGILSRLRSINTDQLMGLPFQQWLATSVKSVRVRSVLSAIVRLSTYSNNPAKLSAGAALRQISLTSQGVLYLDQGWQSIVDSLRALNKNRVRELTGVEVTALTNRNNLVELAMNGGRESFDAVVLALPPGQVNKILPPVHDTERFDRILPSNVACLDVCLKTLPIKDVTFALGIDEPLYYSVHSVGGKLAPTDGALIHLAVYLRSGETGDETHENRLLELMDRLQPGWKSQLVFKRFLPNMTASFGTPLAANSGCNGVADVELVGHHNVFVCGDWVGSGRFLADAAVASALQAADQTIVRLQVQENMCQRQMSTQNAGF